MDISGGSIDAGSGNITLLPSNQTDMRLGAGDGTGTFALSIAELGNITTSGTLTLGNEKTGTVTVDSWVATSTISGEVIRCEPWKGRMARWRVVRGSRRFSAERSECKKIFMPA